MRHVGWLRGAATAALIGLTACPQQTAIWLLSGEEPGRPILGLGQTRDGPSLAEVPYVLVSPCTGFDGTARQAIWVLQWVVAPVAVPVPAPRQVQVGQAPPPGYQVVKGPERLQPGCYIANIQGTGRVEFEVRGDRSSVERAAP